MLKKWKSIMLDVIYKDMYAKNGWKKKTIRWVNETLKNQVVNTCGKNG